MYNCTYMLQKDIARRVAKRCRIFGLTNSVSVYGQLYGKCRKEFERKGQNVRGGYAAPIAVCMGL